MNPFFPVARCDLLHSTSTDPAFFGSFAKGLHRLFHRTTGERQHPTIVSVTLKTVSVVLDLGAATGFSITRSSSRFHWYG